MDAFKNLWVWTLRAFQRVARSVLGRWEPPAWMRTVNRHVGRGFGFLRSHPPLAIATGVAVAGLAGWLAWTLLRTPPHVVVFEFDEPGLTEYNDTGISSIKPLLVRLQRIGCAAEAGERTAVTTGIDVSPSVAGTWFWESDRQLRFTPKDDWPVDGSFTVRFASARVCTRHR